MMGKHEIKTIIVLIQTMILIIVVLLGHFYFNKDQQAYFTICIIFIHAIGIILTDHIIK